MLTYSDYLLLRSAYMKAVSNGNKSFSCKLGKFTTKFAYEVLEIASKELMCLQLPHTLIK